MAPHDGSYCTGSLAPLRLSFPLDQGRRDDVAWEGGPDVAVILDPSPMLSLLRAPCSTRKAHGAPTRGIKLGRPLPWRGAEAAPWRLNVHVASCLVEVDHEDLTHVHANGTLLELCLSNWRVARERREDERSTDPPSQLSERHSISVDSWFPAMKTGQWRHSGLQGAWRSARRSRVL